MRCANIAPKLAALTSKLHMGRDIQMQLHIHLLVKWPHMQYNPQTWTLANLPHVQHDTHMRIYGSRTCKPYHICVLYQDRKWAT
jgi:hypothetical protein